MDRLKKLRIRAREIRQKDGMFMLLKSGIRFLVRPVYQCNLYYLYERQAKAEYSSGEITPRMNTANLNFRIVSSNQEADKLEKENFKFRSYLTTWNTGDNNYRRRLDQGAIAFCTFVGTEFAAVSWVIPSQQAQDSIDDPPLKVDYSNHEVIPKGAWVNPKYRGLELFRYTVINRDRFLAERGTKMTRSTVAYDNKTGKGMTEAIGSRIYGRGRLVKILFWRFWQETLEPEATGMRSRSTVSFRTVLAKSRSFNG
jgi:hypothetical protein